MSKFHQFIRTNNCFFTHLPSWPHHWNHLTNAMDKLQLVAAHNGWVSSICRSDASPSQEMLPLPCQVATCQKLIQPSPNQLFPPNLNPDFHMFELQILQTWILKQKKIGTIRTTRNYYLLCPLKSPPKFPRLDPALRIPDVFSIFHESTTLSDGGLHGALPFGASAVVGRLQTLAE